MTKYDDDLVERAKLYIDVYAKHEKLPPGLRKAVIPTKPGFARYLGVTTRTINIWLKDPDKKEFAEIWQEVHDAKEDITIQKMLLGQINQRAGTLILAQHGYSTRTQVEATGKDGGPIQFENKSEQELNSEILRLQNEVSDTDPAAG